MKAAQIHEYGDSDTLITSTNVAEPTIAPGKVLVTVKVAALNPIDWKIQAGYLQKMLPLELPVTLGADFAGIVKEVGEGVEGFQPGDAVYGQASVMGGASGALAEVALTSAKSVAQKPADISFDVAAASVLTGISAFVAIQEHLKVSAGQKVLIHGGSGGIGSMAIQLAKKAGAAVATTVSAGGEAFVKELGADVVITYTEDAFEDLLEGYDAVFDTVGGDTYAKSFQVLKKGGAITSMVEQPNEALAEKYGVTATVESSFATPERLEKLGRLLSDGSLTVHIDRSFSLEEANEAIDYLKNGHPKGKVIVTVEE